MSTLQDVYAKLEKLRAFAERDCGAETENAIRLIEQLCKKYNIRDFKYTAYTGQAERDMKEAAERQARAEFWYKMHGAKTESTKKQNANANSSASSEREWRKVSYTSTMRDVLNNYLNTCGLKWKAEKNSIYVECTLNEFATFSLNLNRVKAQWKQAQKRANEEVYEWIRRNV